MIKYLQTQGEVHTENYVPEVFVRLSDEGARFVWKNRNRILSSTDEKTKLIRNLLYRGRTVFLLVLSGFSS